MLKTATTKSMKNKANNRTGLRYGRDFGIIRQGIKNNSDEYAEGSSGKSGHHARADG